MYIDPTTYLPAPFGELYSNFNLRLTGSVRINPVNPAQIQTHNLTLIGSPLSGGAETTALIPDDTYTLTDIGSTLWVTAPRNGTTTASIEILTSTSQKRPRKNAIQIAYRSSTGVIMFGGFLIQSTKFQTLGALFTPTYFVVGNTLSADFPNLWTALASPLVVTGSYLLVVSDQVMSSAQTLGSVDDIKIEFAPNIKLVSTVSSGYALTINNRVETKNFHLDLQGPVDGILITSVGSKHNNLWVTITYDTQPINNVITLNTKAAMTYIEGKIDGVGSFVTDVLDFVGRSLPSNNVTGVTDNFAITDKGVVYSSDSGLNWRPLLIPGPTTGTDPSYDTVYSLFKTTHMYYAATLKGLYVNDANLSWDNWRLTASPRVNPVYGVYASPSFLIIYTAEGAGGLYGSSTAGATWSQKSTLNAVAVYAAGAAVYAATTTGLQISADSGTTWALKTTAEGLASNNVLDVYSDGTVIYAATDAGLSISTDNGTTWATALAGSYVNHIFVAGTTIYAATTTGLAISTDSGVTWTTIPTANGLASNVINDVYLNGSLLEVATPNGWCASTDAGVTWVTYQVAEPNNVTLVNGTCITDPTGHKDTQMYTVESFARLAVPAPIELRCAGDKVFDCSQQHIFYTDTNALDSVYNFKLKNFEEGQTVVIAVKSCGHAYTIAWAVIVPPAGAGYSSALHWGPSGIPTPTVLADTYDLYTFIRISGQTFGSVILSMGA